MPIYKARNLLSLTEWYVYFTLTSAVCVRATGERIHSRVPNSPLLSQPAPSCWHPLFCTITAATRQSGQSLVRPRPRRLCLRFRSMAHMIRIPSVVQGTWHRGDFACDSPHRGTNPVFASPAGSLYSIKSHAKHRTSWRTAPILRPFGSDEIPEPDSPSYLRFKSANRVLRIVGYLSTEVLNCNSWKNCPSFPSKLPWSSEIHLALFALFNPQDPSRWVP